MANSTPLLIFGGSSVIRAVKGPFSNMCLSCFPVLVERASSMGNIDVMCDRLHT